MLSTDTATVPATIMFIFFICRFFLFFPAFSSTENRGSERIFIKNLQAYISPLQGNYYVYLFHMPLFFILSGFLFNREQRFGTYFYKKFTGLYIPFAGWNFIIMIVRLIAAQQSGLLTQKLLNGRVENMKLMFLTVGKDGEYMGATWFLGSLFVISIVYKLIDMIIPEIKSKQKIILLIFALIAVYGFRNTLPNGQSRTLILGFFFALGRFLKFYEESFERFTSIIMALLVGVLFWILSDFTRADMGNNEYQNAPLFVICALLGSYIVICISMCLERSGVLFWILSDFTRADMGNNEYQNAPLFVICALLGSYIVICISMCLERSNFSLVEIIRRPLRLLGTNTLDILLWQFVAFRFCVAIQLGHSAWTSGTSCYRSICPGIQILYGQWLVGSLSCYWHRSPAYLGLVPQKGSLGLGSKKTSSCLNLCSPVLLKRTPESILFYTDKCRKNGNPLYISARSLGLGSKKTSSCLNLCSPVLLKRTPESILFYTDKCRKNGNPLYISANKDSFFDKPGSSLLLFPIVICYHNMEEKLQTYILLRRFYQWQHFPIVICYHNMEEKLETYILLRRFYQWQHII